MAQVTKSQMATFYDKTKRLAERAKSLREKAESSMEQVVATMEVAAGAFGMGVLNGRLGGVEIAGVPLDLGAGVLSHVLGHLGVAGKASTHVHNLGNGMLASYMTRLGLGVGKRMEGAPTRDVDLPHDATPASYRIPAGSTATNVSGAGFSDAEIAAMASAERRAA